MRDLLTATIKLQDPTDPEGIEPLTVRAWAAGGRSEVTIQFGYAAPIRMDWSEADALAATLSNAADAICEQNRGRR